MVRWHFPPDTGFEIQTLEVWGRARYLSVTEAPHNTKFYEWMGNVSFKLPRPGNEPRILAWKQRCKPPPEGPRRLVTYLFYEHSPGGSDNSAAIHWCKSWLDFRMTCQVIYREADAINRLMDRSPKPYSAFLFTGYYCSTHNMYANSSRQRPCRRIESVTSDLVEPRLAINLLFQTVYQTKTGRRPVMLHTFWTINKHCGHWNNTKRALGPYWLNPETKLSL